MTVANEVATRTRPWARRRLLLKLAPNLVITTLLVLLAFVSMETLSGLRAYVEGESLWSKAQKEAVRQLEAYAATGDNSKYERYVEEIRVPLGDRDARTEMDREQPDFQRARDGFRSGRVHPDDIPLLIGLYGRFRGFGFMDRAVAIWKEGDREVDEIIAAGKVLHELLDGSVPEAVRRSEAHQAAVAGALARLRAADARATPLEQRFSATLGDAARQVGVLLQVAMLVLAAAMLLVTLSLSLWMWRRNSKIERALRLSEERFDLAVRGSNDGIWNWNAETDEAYLSPRVLELLGLTAGGAAPNAAWLLARVHEDDRELVRHRIRETLLSRAPLDLELRFQDAVGKERWAHVRGRLLSTSDGAAIRAAGSISDISARKLADEQRRQLALEEQRRHEQEQIALLEKVQGRMGRELHDDLGQQLTGIAFLAKALEQRLGTASREWEQAAWIVRLINEAIDRVRFMSRQLSPIAIDEVTLGTALQRLVDDIHDIFGTRITLDKTGDETQLPSGHASQFFRIAQEAVSNALRHGGATRIRVHLYTGAGRARLSIVDNGGGFDLSSVDVAASLGLRSMAIRAEAMQGRLRIRSTRRGTILIVNSGCESTARGA